MSLSWLTRCRQSFKLNQALLHEPLRQEKLVTLEGMFPIRLCATNERNLLQCVERTVLAT